MARSILYSLVLLLVVPAAQAQESSPWITVGKHEVHPTRIVARLAPGLDLTQPEVQALMAELGLQVRREYKLVPGLVAFDTSASPLAPQAVVPPPPDDPGVQVRQLLDRIAALRDTGWFLYVSPSHIQRPLLDPNDARYVDGTLWGLRNLGLQGGVVGADINARQAWDVTTGSRDVIVAVLDTGVRYTHQDLRNNMWRNPGETRDGTDSDGNGYVDDIHGINVIEGTGDPMDFDDHGTHVAGTIGATANDGFPHVGVAWQVSIMAVRFIGPQGGALDDEIEAIEYAVQNGAHIINASYGSYFANPAQFDAILAAREAGVLFVAAAGNDAIDGDVFPMYPASHPLDNIISVAALDRADRLATFSNFGIESVDLGAPGHEIFSAASSADNDYITISGTSMAAPHVAGVAALIRAAFPDASLAEVRERVLRTTVPIPALQGLTVTGGRVSAYKALVAEPDGELEITIDPPSGSLLLAGSEQPMFVQVSDIFSVTDATVTGRIADLQLVFEFANDGQPPDQVEGDNIYSALLDVPTNRDSVTIQITVEAPGKTTANVFVTYAIQPPPPNDDFVNALKIAPEGARIRTSNQLATTESGEPFHAGIPSAAATLWWNYSSPVDTPVLVDPAGSSFDTVIAVYTGSSVTTLTEVASVDDVNGRQQGYLEFNARAGVTYRVVVGGYSATQTGTIQLRVQPNGRPDVTPPLASIETPISGLTVSARELIVEGIAIDPEPDPSGVRQVNVRVNQEPVGRTALGTTNWVIPVLLQPGENIISAHARDGAGNVGPETSVMVRYVVQDPPNDHFANATELEGATGAVTGDNTRATKEYQEPNHAGNEGGRSVWWRWTAPGDGAMSLTTVNSTFDTLLAVYTGDRLENLVVVASNDDAPGGGTHSALTFAARADVTYHIAVDGFSGLSGEIRLAYEFTPSAVFELTVVAGPGGSVTPPSGEFPAGTEVLLTALPESDYEFAGWTELDPAGLNPITITIDGDRTATATFRLRSFTEDFESGAFRTDLNWNRNPAGSVAAWFVQSEQVGQGQYSARSGAIGHGQRSSVVLTADLDAGVGSFSYRVSSEANFDRLEFYIDGELNAQWSGHVPWRTHQFSIPVGAEYVLEWRYIKDFTIQAGDDAAFLDSIQLPVAAPEVEAARLQLSYVAQDARLVLRGLHNRLYVIEASGDLVNWEPIASEIAVNGIIQIHDPQVAQDRTRFYRAIQP